MNVYVYARTCIGCIGVDMYIFKCICMCLCVYWWRYIYIHISPQIHPIHTVCAYAHMHILYVLDVFVEMLCMSCYACPCTCPDEIPVVPFNRLFPCVRRISQDLAKDLAILAREIHDVAGEIDSVSSSGTAPSTTVSTAATTPGSAIDTREEVGSARPAPPQPDVAKSMRKVPGLLFFCPPAVLIFLRHYRPPPRLPPASLHGCHYLTATGL